VRFLFTFDLCLMTVEGPSGYGPLGGPCIP
jgi:hypothetical protein